MSPMMSGRVRIEQIVVAAQVARVIREPLAAEVRLGQLVALDHRAHRAVEDEDASSRSESASASDASVSGIVLLVR